jgi:hypothetical protein
MWVAPASAWAACDWVVQGRVHVLQADCQISETIEIPDGATIDGQRHRIDVVDPAWGPFAGAAFVARGRLAHVRDVTIDGSRLGPACQSGARRLAGILFDGASGTIERVSIHSLARFNGTCAEGTGLEIVGAPHGRPGREAQAVLVRASTVEQYQKGGLAVGGDVLVVAEDNRFVAPAAPLLPTNGVQVAFGARARLVRNTIEGASWCCTEVAAAGILLLDAAPGTEVRGNRIEGNADVGIFAMGRHFVIEGNVVTDRGADGLFDIGILATGPEHVLRGNVVRGFTVPYDGQRAGEARSTPRATAD